jgi:hypothetical protein
MELKSGDWVITEAGEAGKVVYLSRLTVFVAISLPPQEQRVEAFLASQLTRSEQPEPLPL